MNLKSFCCNKNMVSNFIKIILFLVIVYQLLPHAFLHSVRAPSLLIISFDGFRWDYLTRTSTPNFDSVIRNGVHVTDGLQNIFTTSTLTNHWSMVTGLYAESHGIVENEMFDPLINKSFVPLYKNRFAVNDPRYYDVPGVEPIWMANQRQKEHGRSGSVMWWGAENVINSQRPTYHMPYNRDEDDVYKINTLLSWFDNEHPINLGLLYFPNPDHIAHKCGPESVNVTEAIARADELLGILFKGLKKLELLTDLNIIVTSDHGFASMSKKRLIDLDKIVDPSWYKAVHYNPVATIIPIPGYEEKVYDLLHTASLSLPFTVYKKADIPERLHYKHSTRVTPIIMLAELTWAFIGNKHKAYEFKLAGGHGYDNKYKEMRPFFMAMGPSFKTNFTMDTFESIDMYALMCELLDLEPNANNGTLTKVSRLLNPTHENEKTMWTFANYLIILIFVSSVGGIFIVAGFRQISIRKRKPGQRKTMFGRPSKTSRSLVADNRSMVKLLSDNSDDDLGL